MKSTCLHSDSGSGRFHCFTAVVRMRASMVVIIIADYVKETRSKTTVTLLSRFCNCISYQDAQRYIATMAKSVDEQICPEWCLHTN